MIFMVIIKKVKSLFCVILHLLSRCFCCLKRKHQISGDDFLPITVTNANNKEFSDDNEFDKWDSWDGPSCVLSDGRGAKREFEGPKMSPLEMQIYEYRLSQQIKMTQPPPEPEPEPDYFQELAPKIPRKPQVVILARPEEEQQVSNRISLSLSEPQLKGSELLEWDEDGVDGGWEEEADEDLNLDAAIRDQRERLRQERKLERLKKKAEKENSKLLTKQTGQKIALKLS